MGGTVILLIILAVVVLYGVSAYNGLINLKNQTLNAFKQIDVQLKRRHDLIPNLVNAVKGAMDFERQTLEAVIQARNQAVAAGANAAPGAVKQIAAAENQLTAALSRFNVVVEQYPQLKATAQRGPAAGRADLHREPDRLRAAAVQRHGDPVQHQAAAVPDQPVRRASPRPRPPSCGRSPMKASAPCRRSISR